MFNHDYVVFTGTLRTMTRKQAKLIVEGLGGTNQSSVTKQTTILVKGYFTMDLIMGDRLSKKVLDTQQAVASGQPIIVMEEKEFLDYLSQYFQSLSTGL
ncbi:BRCT domain-containing protein [Enterococcus faecalis]|nr:BRCT domain-containing protein [Enterococcus faecalis]